jgi:hypothetical protein
MRGGLGLLVLLSTLACKKVEQLLLPDLREDPLPAVSVDAESAAPGLLVDAGVPAVAPSVALSDGGVASAEFAEALALRAAGAHWLGQLKLQAKALGSTGTHEELVLLRSMCAEQQDAACVRQCDERLGTSATTPQFDRKMAELAKRQPVAARDALLAELRVGGLSAPSAALLGRLCSAKPAPACAITPSASPAPVSSASVSSGQTNGSRDASVVLEDARAAMLEGKFAQVRALLYPGVSAGGASKDATTLLRASCMALRDNACVAMTRARP